LAQRTLEVVKVMLATC